MIRWGIVEALDAAVFRAPAWLAQEYFLRTDDLAPLKAVARASCTWRRALAWLFFAPTNLPEAE